MSPYFSADFRLGFGLGDDTQEVFSRKTDLAIKETLSILFLFEVPQAIYRLSPYIGVGGTYTAVEGENSEERVRASYSDLSFSIGSRFEISRRWSFSVDHTRHIDSPDFKFSAFRANLLWKYE